MHGYKGSVQPSCTAEDYKLDLERKAKGAAVIDVYGFLATEPNAIVAPIHPKAMPLSSYQGIRRLGSRRRDLADVGSQFCLRRWLTAITIQG